MYWWCHQDTSSEGLLSCWVFRCIAVQELFITPSAKKKQRIKWVEDNQNTNWDTIIWTDESTVELGKHPSHQQVTRLLGEEYLPECIEPTFHSGRKSLKVWGAIATGRKGPLIRLELGAEDEERDKNGKKKRKSGLNGPKYVDQVLNGPLRDFVREMEIERVCEMLLVEDGAPGHRSKVASQARSEVGIKRHTHPAKSPDLNPIEPLWNLIKNHVADIPGSGNTLDKLWAALQKVWDELTEEDIEKYTGTMADRVQAVNDAKGWHTHY